jgi:hypothetical protein
MAEHRWIDPVTNLPCIAVDEPIPREDGGPFVVRAFGVEGIAGREILKLAKGNRELVRSGLGNSSAFQDDLASLLRAAGLPDSARAASPHRVVREELLPQVQHLAARERVLAERVTELESRVEAQVAILDASDKLRAVSAFTERSRLRQGIENEIVRYGPDSYCRTALRLLRDRLVPEDQE